MQANRSCVSAFQRRYSAPLGNTRATCAIIIFIPSQFRVSQNGKSSAGIDESDRCSRRHTDTRKCTIQSSGSRASQHVLHSRQGRVKKFMNQARLFRCTRRACICGSISHATGVPRTETYATGSPSELQRSQLEHKAVRMVSKLTLRGYGAVAGADQENNKKTRRTCIFARSHHWPHTDLHAALFEPPSPVSPHLVISTPSPWPELRNYR